MSYLGKTFVIDKSENAEELLKALELPSEIISAMISHKTKYKLEKDGDSYTLTISLVQGPRQVKFTSGVEIDEEIMENVIVKSLFTVNGNVITQTQKLPTYTINRKLEFSDNGIVETVTASVWNGTARHTFIPA